MMIVSDWFSDHYIEIFGAITGILYVFLEIRQTIWLWPVGIITSAVYIWVFFEGKLYADMSLQVYYLVISILGWYWWVKGSGRRTQDAGKNKELGKGRRGEMENAQYDSPFEGGQGDVKHKSVQGLVVSRLNLKTAIILLVFFGFLYAVMWLVLERLTDSPVPQWDSFITSLSIIATWMLARKIYEHWFLWIVVNSAAATLFYIRGLYPTVVLYLIYGIMSFAGLRVWKKTISAES